MSERDAERQTERSKFGVRNGESPGYFYTATGQVNAHSYVALGLHLHAV